MLKTIQTLPADIMDLSLKHDLNEEFLFNLNTEKSFFGTELYTYLYEGFNDNRLILASDKYGSAMCAVETNDCKSDNFEKNHYARLALRENYYVYVAEKKEENINMVIFRVVRYTDDITDNSVVVQFVNKLMNVKKSNAPYIFRSAVDHVIKFFNTDGFSNITQLSPKFSYSGTRSTMIRLFAPSSNGNLKSYTNNGNVLYINPWTKEKFPEIESTNRRDVSVCRVFFSKKKSNESSIPVDGIRLDLLNEEDVDIFIKSIPKGLFKGELVKLSFDNTDTQVYGIQSINDHIRVIFVNNGKFKSFRLNVLEETLVTKIYRLGVYL